MHMNVKFIGKLFGLCLVFLCLGLEASSGLAGASASALQAMPGVGTVYLTRGEDYPKGAVVKPLDLQLGLMQTVIHRLSEPFSVLCGPDRRLYVHSLWEPVGQNKRVSRIYRFNQDGTGRVIIAEWDWKEIYPTSMVIASNGDLYFGTATTPKGGQLHDGVWRIPGALQADREFNPPEQVLLPNLFTPPPNDRTGAGAFPYAFLTAGPFVGDLLIVDQPRSWEAPGAGSEDPGDRILRALAPDFTQVEEFIPRHLDPETGKSFQADGLAVNSQGDLLISDGKNNKILRYSPDGEFKGIFAHLDGPGPIAVGPDGLIYVTNGTWRDGSVIVQGSLFIFDAEGNLVASADFPMHLVGVTVCIPQGELN